MSLGSARHQMPGQPGRTERRLGESLPDTGRDEARLARHETEGLERDDLLTQALARGNLVLAWKRVKANRGSTGVDGLTIQEISARRVLAFNKDDASFSAPAARPCNTFITRLPGLACPDANRHMKSVTNCFCSSVAGSPFMLSVIRYQ